MLQQPATAMVDGGVFANNPAMCAYVEAIKLHGPGDILVVSLGTGQEKTPIHYLQARTWGLIGWARQLINVFMDGVSDTVEHQLGWLLPDRDGTPRYFRFQTELPPGMGSMDDTSPKRIEALKQAAQALITANTDKIDTLCQATHLGRGQRRGMNVRSGKPLGINTLLFTILFVTLLAYLAIWGWVIWQIWDGDSTDINAAAIYAGSAIGGTLSGFFAFTLGIRVGTAQPGTSHPGYNRHRDLAATDGARYHHLERKPRGDRLHTPDDSRDLVVRGRRRGRHRDGVLQVRQLTGIRQGGRLGLRRARVRALQPGLPVAEVTGSFDAAASEGFRRKK